MSLILTTPESRLTGKEKFIIWCSPQNPSGRIWTVAELRAVADFAARNGLMLVSDEVHHDLVYPRPDIRADGRCCPGCARPVDDLTAASKTFNIAGQQTGNVIIADATLRGEMAARLRYAWTIWPNGLGLQMVTAAYSPEGAAWADAQMVHLDSVRQIFDAGVECHSRRQVPAACNPPILPGWISPAPG